jgi:hypothetical protein
VSTTPLVHLEQQIFPQIFEKIETALMGYSVAWGKMIQEKTQSRKSSGTISFTGLLQGFYRIYKGIIIAVKVVNEYRFFTVKKHKYVWDTELGTFFPTQGTDTNIRYTELGTFFPTQGTDTNIRYTELGTFFPTQGTDTNIKYTVVVALIVGKSLDFELNTFKFLIFEMFTLKSACFEGNKKFAL